MLELCTAPARRSHETGSPAGLVVDPAPAYSGPERRGGTALLTGLMTLMLDEVDYGLLLLSAPRPAWGGPSCVDGDGPRVLHANHAARTSLGASQHPLQLLGQELRARSAKDAAPLHQALQAAASRGLRRLLTLGEGAQRAGVAIVPLGGEPAAMAGRVAPATLVVLGRREVCGGLSVQGFAREHRLSPSEAQVLALLCEGCCPNEIAERHGVKIATVRTQIANIRAKTGTDSIRDLVQQVAVLPPLVGALRRQAEAGGRERAVA